MAGMRSVCDTRHKEGRGEALVVILVVWTKGECTDERTAAGGLSEGGETRRKKSESCWVLGLASDAITNYDVQDIN